MSASSRTPWNELSYWKRQLNCRPEIFRIAWRPIRRCGRCKTSRTRDLIWRSTLRGFRRGFWRKPFGVQMATNSKMRPMQNFPDEGFDLEIYVEGLQKGFLEEALRRTNGVQVKAAELLRMSYRSFRHYMQKYNIAS